MSDDEKSDYQTRASLLLKLQDPDSKHWDEFYNMYSGLIFNYALTRGCNENMAKDVMQETLLTVYQYLPDFDYDRKKGQFRSWLLCIVHSRLMDAYRREKKYSNDEASQLKAFQEYEAESYEDFTDSWDQEWKKNLFNIALEELKRHVQEDSFEAFRLLALEERPVKEIEEKLGMSANTIYQIRHRLLKKLTSITDQLKEELGE